MSTLWSRLLGLLGRRHRDRDLVEDIETHLALLTDDYLRQGLSPSAARSAARRRFGGIDQMAEVYRDRRSIGWLEDLVRDSRLALRSLIRTPRLTAVIVVTLALGIGATTAIFSVINALVLRPLPVPDADRLVRFIVKTGTTTSSAASGHAFTVWREQTRVVEQVAAHRLEYVNLTGVSDPEQVPLARVSSAFLPLFHAAPHLGRLFSEVDDAPGGPPVALLSHTFWTRRFHADPTIVGHPIMLGNTPHRIVGVLSRSFETEQFDPTPEVWVPLQLDPTRVDGGNLFTVTGRLTPGTTRDAANAQLAVAATHASPNARVDARPRSEWGVVPVREAMIGDLRPALSVLAAGAGLLLLIACANASNLLVARAGVRTRERAIRAAVGAGRGRLIRQLLTEGVLVATLGGGLGLLVGLLGVRALLAWYPATNPFVLAGATGLPRMGTGGAGVGLDGRVLAFAAATTILSSLLVCVWPALRASRPDSVGPLPSIGTVRTGRSRMQRALVVIEVALAVMLLTASGLLLRASWALQGVERGFDAEPVTTARMSVGATRFDTRIGLEVLTRDGIGALHAVPGVTSAAATCCMPLETVWQLPFVILGRPPETLTTAGTMTFTGFGGWTFVTPGYFDVLGVSMLRGRDFTADDRAGAPGVVIINEAMARQFWRDEDPLQARLVIGKGMRPEYDEEPIRQIVGIVGNVRDTGLTRPVRPAMYVPMAQEPDGVTKLNVRLLPIVWMVRTAVPPDRVARPMTEALQRVSGLPVTRLRSMSEVVAESTARFRFNTIVMVVFGGCALVLAVMGVYGVIAYSVQQRTAELGIRLALGATTARLQRMVLGQGASLIGAGIAVGVGASLALARVMAALLFGVGARDPVAFTVAPVVLGVVALAAVWVPARRATRLDPVAALKAE